MILYGSQTSPFVRRLRLLLPENSYEFRKVDIFNSQERQNLLALSPLLKIPILEVEGSVIWDSRVIFNELCHRGYHPQLDLPQENLLTAISDVSDSLVQRLLSIRSKVDLPKGTPLEVSHRERIENTFKFLSQKIEANAFKQWDFPAMCLYTLLDWTEFRDLADLSPFPLLKDFVLQNKSQPRVGLTDPRAQ